MKSSLNLDEKNISELLELRKKLTKELVDLNFLKPFNPKSDVFAKIKSLKKEIARISTVSSFCVNISNQQKEESNVTEESANA